MTNRKLEWRATAEWTPLVTVTPAKLRTVMPLGLIVTWDQSTWMVHIYCLFILIHVGRVEADG